MRKLTKLEKVALGVSVFLILGGLAGLLTNQFVTRSDYSSLERCEELKKGSDDSFCDDVPVGSTGWPFPSTTILSDGTRATISYEESTCYKCAETAFGPQIIYNSLFFSLTFAGVYLLAKRLSRNR